MHINSMLKFSIHIAAVNTYDVETTYYIFILEYRINKVQKLYGFGKCCTVSIV